jgi:energy-coupling factor transporter ATP-binding protein EcfA2
MDATAVGFPGDLLTQPWCTRLQYFQTYTMAHPRLVAARDALLNAIHEVPPNSLILVLGPTGVGKTTLRMKIEQLLAAELQSVLERDPARLPVVSVECIAPDSGSFNWRDHFRRFLLQMEEPLVDYKITPAAPVRIGTRATRFLPSERAVGVEYRHAVEQALRFRRPVAVLLDEAQHMARMGSGRRLSEQLDVLKSLANRTHTVHVMIGTYELLAFRHLSAQLSRRSLDLHFPRYQAEQSDQWQAFRTVVRSFARQLPLAEPPQLLREADYLYERSIGCVGILKDWLMRVLASLARRNAASLTHRDLQVHALSVAQCETMLTEIAEGERRLQESPTDRSRLRTRLGLPPQEHARDEAAGQRVDLPRKSPSIRQVRRTPGHRRPVRDAIGTTKGNDAQARTL